jgi:hypothetical protein
MPVCIHAVIITSVLARHIKKMCSLYCVRFLNRFLSPLFPLFWSRSNFCRGVGDRHDRSYDAYMHSVSLSEDVMFLAGPVPYTISIHPHTLFFKSYSTNNPRLATFGAVCIIIFTSFLFIMYDYCVRQEIYSKEELLQAKRQFMRYVSHEVRTPLNSVSMGLTVLKEELEMFIRKHEEQRYLPEKDEMEGLVLQPPPVTEVNDCKVENDLSTMPVASNGISDNIIQQNCDVESGLQRDHNTTIESKQLSECVNLTSEIFRNTQSAVAILNDLLKL